MCLLIRSVLFIMLGLSLAACNKQLTNLGLPSTSSAVVTESGIYYTQIVLHYEKNIYPTTNYQIGAMLPVNTPVKILEKDSKTIAVELADSGQKLTVKNIAKHTGDDIEQTFNKLFARQKINLSQFSSKEKNQIEAGKVAVGMHKKAVTVAIGYPPITRTQSLAANSWVYWRNRFNTFIVNFKNDKVTDIVD